MRLGPTSGDITDTWGDLTTVSGVAVGRDGAVYASELFGGAHEDRRRCTRTSKAVPFPAGVAVDEFNNVYVAA